MSTELPPLSQAFILCAGLGTRMQPLTSVLPKPLIPLFQAPMITYILGQYRKLGIRHFIINTHHLADAWHDHFPDGTWNDCTLHFVNEPVLLDTGGGLRNIRHLVDMEKPLLIHNGDIVTTLDVHALVRRHLNSEALVTLALRSQGELGNVGFDAETSLITDMRNSLGVTKGTHEFASIYCIQPEIIDMIPPDTAVSIIPTLLELIARKRVQGIVLDQGLWFNVGTPDIYLEMHRQLARVLPPEQCRKIHQTAQIDPSAVLDSDTVVCAGARIGKNCNLSNCIVWPNVEVCDGIEAKNQVFFI